MWVVYETSKGYGSVAKVTEHSEGWLRVDDPVLGEEVIDPLRTIHVVQAPQGVVLPFHHFGLPYVTEYAANPEGPVSGYPAAWKRIERWRNRTALRWQTVALVGVFTALTIRDSYEKAEDVYEDIGPTLRAFLNANIIPTEGEIAELLVERGHRGLLAKRSATLAEAITFSGPLASRLRGDPDDSRGFRNRVALEMRLPLGIGLPKLSFWVSLLGRDAACIDAQIMAWWFGKDAERLLKQFEKKRGELNERRVVKYNDLEDMLRTERAFWDPEAPMPYAQAQWMLWERAIGDVAAHEALFRVVR